jgi:opacity protein-like surface antigen
MTRASAVSGSLMLLVAVPAIAADVAFDPKVAVMGVVNDNNRMTDVPGEEIDVAGAKIDAEVTLSANTERTTFRLTPRLRSSFYPNDESEEADDQFVLLDWRHSTERTRWDLGADYSRVATFSSFLPESRVDEGSNLGDPDLGVSVGSSTGRNRQDRFSIRPEVRFDLTERYRLEFRVDYLDVSYDTQVSGDREDYQSLRGSVGFRTQLSETQNLLLRAGYGQYDPAADDSTDSYGVDGRWSYDLSETAQAYVRAGVNNVETQPTATEAADWETGFTGGAGVRWAFEVTDLWLDVSQYLNPNSSGNLVTRNELRLQLWRRISPTVRLSAAGRLMQDSGATDADDFREQTYATGGLGFEWRWARQWMLRGAYDYQWREYDDAPTNAESNAFNLGVVWQPMRR